MPNTSVWDSELVFIDQLEELYELADEIMSAMGAAGDVLPRTEDTIYAQCGRKPRWPFWASHSFRDVWACL